MKTRFTYILILFSLAARNSSAQELTQTVRGKVVDRVSQAPLPGAVVQILNSTPPKAAACDEQGNFSIPGVAVGKQSLRFSFIGYKETVMNHLNVNSGKELVINAQLDEDATVMNEVEVTTKRDMTKPLNEMSSVSTRAFSVEETQKFAAAVNDPARMATSFAGVVQAGDGNNHISIRGNSPNGLLWRMEGVEIPNPNHFANVGTSGGGISILSAQLLNNSDFSTGAFAAEYGNALSGVFDLKLRKGNNQKREYTFQAGVLGIDAALEGPLRKGGEGSYLVNYRYSTLSILGKIGVPLGDGVTNFQDLSFNVSMPSKKLGTFTMFGFGGLSSQYTTAKSDSLLWKESGFSRYNSNFYANTGALGFTNTKLFAKGYLKTVLAVSATENGYYEDEMQKDYTTLIRQYSQRYIQDKVTFSSVYTHKFNARSSIRAGGIGNRLGYNLNQKFINDSSVLETKIAEQGNTHTMQGFFQWNYKISQKLTSNVGAHYFHLLLNNTNSFEPRASLRYEATRRNVFTVGYGLHSQIQPLGVYFEQKEIETNTFATPNRNLELSKAHHLVTGYDRILTEHSHAKVEVYYQHLFNVPVSTDKNSTYSILNSTDGYYTGELHNAGLGVNKGVELTYERFLHKDLYWLLSASLYDSKYQAPDGNWYNTQFNTNYAVTLTAGKEWVLSSKRKNRIIGFNIKSVAVGGFRYTPIDLAASRESGHTEQVEGRAFESQAPAYYRLDVKLSVKRNYKNLTSTFAIDIQNVTNHKNIGGQYFDADSGDIKYWYQAPLIPILSYKVEF